MRSIGVDLHKTMFVVCWLQGQDKKFERFELREIGRFKSRLRKTDRMAVEATGNARYFAGQIRASVSEVKVANPRQFRVISHSVKIKALNGLKYDAKIRERGSCVVLLYHGKHSEMVKLVQKVSGIDVAVLGGEYLINGVASENGSLMVTSTAQSKYVDILTLQICRDNHVISSANKQITLSEAIFENPEYVILIEEFDKANSRSSSGRY